MIWGEIIRSYRDAHGLSQAEVARRLGISRNYVSMLERGKARNPSHRLAERILNLHSPASWAHRQVLVTLERRVWVDASIAPEIVWLNSQGVTTVGSCEGPPPTAMILPSGFERAVDLGYAVHFREDVGLYEIDLKSEVADEGV